MSMSDDEKLKLFKSFVQEVGWFGQTFSLTMEQLVETIRADGDEEISDAEMHMRQHLVTTLLERISRDLSELRRHYFFAMESIDYEEDEEDELLLEFPKFTE